MRVEQWVCLAAWAIVAYTRPAAGTTDGVALLASELAAWQSFYDAAGGANWRLCQKNRDTPCACPTLTRSQIVCKLGKIVSIRLQDVRINVPNDESQTRAAAAALHGLSGLTSLDLRNTGSTVSYYNAFKWVCFPLLCNSSQTCRLPSSVTNCLNTKAPTTPAPTQAPTTRAPTHAPTPPTPEPTQYPSTSPTARPTQFPTKQPTMLRDDMLAWYALYDTLNGPNWTHCSNKRDDPCSCNSSGRVVRCSGANITSIELQNNNVIGSQLPELRLRGMRSLEILKLDNQQASGGEANELSFYVNGGLPCVDLPRCGTPGVSCTLPPGVLFCHETAPPTRAPTRSPTLKFSLHPDDAPFWQALYAGTGGSSGKWTLGANRGECSLRVPCGCGDGVERFVACDANNRVAEIVLPRAGMAGLFPATEMPRMSALRRLVVSGNSFSNTGCVSLPGCISGLVACDLSSTSLALCATETTLAPTLSPTEAPTVRPSAKPATAAPTATPAPTSTLAPTQSPTEVLRRDYLCRIRFVRAKLDSMTSLPELHLGYLRRAFPEAQGIEVLGIWEGSVGVDFALLGLAASEDALEPTKLVRSIVAAMSAGDALLLPNSLVEVLAMESLSANATLPPISTPAPTREDGAAQDSSGSMSGAVVGCSIGGAFLVILSAGVFVIRKRRRFDGEDEEDPGAGAGKRLSRRDSVPIIIVDANKEEELASRNLGDLEMQARGLSTRPSLRRQLSSRLLRRSSSQRVADSLSDQEEKHPLSRQSSRGHDDAYDEAYGEYDPACPEEDQISVDNGLTKRRSLTRRMSDAAIRIARTLSDKVVDAIPGSQRAHHRNQDDDDDDDDESDVNVSGDFYALGFGDECEKDQGKKISLDVAFPGPGKGDLTKSSML